MVELSESFPSLTQETSRHLIDAQQHSLLQPSGK